MVAWQGMLHTLLRPGNEEYSEPALRRCTEPAVGRCTEPAVGRCTEPAVGRCTDLLWEGGVAEDEGMGMRPSYI